MRALTRVDALVQHEARGQSEGLAAHGAGVGLLPGVHALVLHQRRGLREGLAAERAAVRPLGRVRHLVQLQLRQPRERAPALGALERAAQQRRGAAARQAQRRAARHHGGQRQPRGVHGWAGARRAAPAAPLPEAALPLQDPEALRESRGRMRLGGET